MRTDLTVDGIRLGAGDPIFLLGQTQGPPGIVVMGSQGPPAVRRGGLVAVQEGEEFGRSILVVQGDGRILRVSSPLPGDGGCG